MKTEPERDRRDPAEPEEATIVRRVAEAKDDPAAADALIRDYLPFIRAQASKALGRIVSEGQDEMSIAMIGFHDAIGTYAKWRGAFLKYASLVIRRRLIDYYRREKRHGGQLSLDDDGGEDGAPLADRLEDRADDYAAADIRSATRQEIAELTAQIAGFGLSVTDIADNCPRQQRTLAACQKALGYARENPGLIDELKKTGRLPLSKIVAGTGLERKTLERHRKYLLVLLLIYSNGYDIIRGHLKQVLSPEKGGTVL